MDKISELMDGELDSYDAAIHLKRLKEDEKLQESWELYHLVGDALRRESGLATRITQGVSARLESEPTVMAPRFTAPRRVTRFAMSAAAGVAGLAVVGWLALSGLPGGSGLQQQVAMTPAVKAVATGGAVTASETVVAQSTALPTNDPAVEDYLLAHQAASNFRTMQGSPLYVRPVAAEASR